MIPGILDSDLMPPYDELVKPLLCKYELCKLPWEEAIRGEVYKCDDTAEECARDEDGVDASDVDEADDCKSYFDGELRCMFDKGEVSGYEA